MSKVCILFDDNRMRVCKLAYEKLFFELLEKGYSLEEITENIYLNYNAYDDVDIIYRTKKLISQSYNCPINSIKLIGSAHTGFSVDKFNLLTKQPADYDFAIVDAAIFIKFYHKIVFDNLTSWNKKHYVLNFVSGKIHPLYINRETKDEINKINKSIQEKMGLTKHITICFYLSEESFIKNLLLYYNDVYTNYLKQIAKDTLEVVDNIELRKVPKLERAGEEFE